LAREAAAARTAAQRADQVASDCEKQKAELAGQLADRPPCPDQAADAPAHAPWGMLTSLLPLFLAGTGAGAVPAGVWLAARFLAGRAAKRIAAHKKNEPDDEEETHAPIEREEREGLELLQLAQLEGRDPLQDAIAGRLIRNRIDSIADSASDPQKARWADDLRREIDQRYNEVAPTKFQFPEV